MILFASSPRCAEAFLPGVPLPEAPAFHHAFAGLLMLADWLGSDERFFPYADGQCPDRMAFSAPSAVDALRMIGLDAATSRAAVQRRPMSFSDAFGLATPRPIQHEVTRPDANLLVLEAETGSGKTEAALWRFMHLFRRGEVDGLYFALPTRVAATQIFQRVKVFRDRVFIDGDRPAVVLAVPGQMRVDDAEGRPLPGFEVQWNDHPDDVQRQRWAAERPKRYLAAQIAVGTIDQALLGSIRVKHAHLRGTALLRHLLVVDEVHASDRYMEGLLANLLGAHLQVGGHALLLSATLGAAMRARLLGAAVPAFADAEAITYPALTWNEDGQERRKSVAAEGAPKRVGVEQLPIIDRHHAVAALALNAAQRGAKVLVLRNTVGAAIETMRRLEEQAGLGRSR
jgi:CRISPR-associated endonuclease/helicase Cas3